MEPVSSSLRDAISSALTTFNMRQEAHAANCLSDVEYNGLRGLVMTSVQAWMRDELAKVESHFDPSIGATADDRAYIERLLISLVMEWGEKRSETEFGMFVARDRIDNAIGLSAEIVPDQIGNAQITVSL